MADIPLAIQEMIFGNKIDENGVLVRASTDKPPYFAVGFMSEKANGKYRYIWLYKVRAKPVTENYSTKAGTTVTRQTGEVEWTAIKRTHDKHYLALKFEAAEDATVKVNLLGGQKGEITLPPEDRDVVFLIRDKSRQSIQAIIEKEGHKKELAYALTGLTLEKPQSP